jgi:hypothetical protein
MGEHKKDDVLQSLIRTLVPIGVGAVMASVVGPYVDPGALRDLLAGLIAGGYYTVVRLLEMRAPGLGVLLGSRRQPMYW